jgi:molecular chaperone DnaK
MAADNKSLGRFQLTDIPPAQRGMPQIEVIFDIDANGIMNISAKDKGTGKEQSIKIEASSGLSEEEIEKMKAEAEANAESDQKAREAVEAVNKADSLIFQTERQLKEYGDKIPADKKQPIEDALAALKVEFEAKNMDNLEPAMEKLNEVFQAASEEMYAAANDGGNAEGAGSDAGAEGAPEDEVTDVDFEEVEEVEEETEKK